jgi:acetyl esterase/lipase
MRARLLFAIALLAPVVAAQGLYTDVASGRDGARTKYVLALDRSAAAVAKSAAEQRTYFADESLGSPAGFSFFASNNNGVYDIGDHAPMIARTRLAGSVPAAAHLRIVKGEATLAEADGKQIAFTPAEGGAYRLIATIDGKAWIETSPLYLEPTEGRGIALPPTAIAETVEVRKGISYVEGPAADADKHKLDLYLPKGRTGFPVFVFIHGGAWRSGDRAQYPMLGNRFAKEGIGVVVPSYRLMPGAPHPAQIEDALAAVDWAVAHAREFGGDPKRIYVGGHSAGGHLSAFAGLDPRFRGKLKGVIPMSGVYDLTQMAAAFPADKVDPSPMHRVAAGAAPFLITYCQNDYPSLPAQARAFHAALEKAGVKAELVYVPGRNHISEMTEIWRDDDPTARAVLRFIER